MLTALCWASYHPVLIFCVSSFYRHVMTVYEAILKNMYVGGNPSCSNLEALLEKFFQVFLRFSKNIFQ